MTNRDNPTNRNIIFNSDDETRTMFESILFYLGISKEKILAEDYGNLGNSQIVSIVDCINVLRASNYLLDSPLIEDNETYAVNEWMVQNSENYGKLTE